MASIKRYATAKGERWRVQYRTPENRVTQRRGFKSKKAAEDFAAGVHMSKLRGEYVDPSDARRRSATSDRAGSPGGHTSSRRPAAPRRSPGASTSNRGGAQ